MKETIIKPRSGWIPLNFRQLFEFKDLFVILITRELKLRYKQTAIGILWVILQPLLTVILFTAIFGKLAKLPTEGVPYLLFAFSGMLPWVLFSQSVLRSSCCLVTEARLISKVYFPRILLPFAACWSVVADFLVCLVMMLGLMIFYEIPVTWNLLAFFPLSLLVLFFAMGMSAWISSLNVYYRDFAYVVPFLIQIWMYASPIVYSHTMIPTEWQSLYALNPLSGMIDSFRWSLLGLSPFPWYSFSISFVATVSVFFLGVIIFKRVERYFADVI